MSTISKWRRLGLFVSTIVLSIGLMGCASVKWDEHDPGLHGQTFRLTEPFVYHSPDRWRDRREYDPETMKIGRYLMSRKSARMREIDIEELESVAEGEVFTIEKSYLTGTGMLEQLALTPPLRMLIVTSSDSVNATTAGFYLGKTDRNDLFELLRKK